MSLITSCPLATWKLGLALTNPSKYAVLASDLVSLFGSSEFGISIPPYTFVSLWAGG